MAEQLLTIMDVCKRLNISRDSFYRHEAELKADGLQEVKFSHGIKKRLFRAASLDAIIEKAAKTENPIGQLKRKKNV